MAMYPCLFGGGSGPAPVLITKNITQNGTYNASADNADGYSQVKVEVSGGGSTLGEKTISTYGVFNASDDSLDGYSKVTNVTGLETATASGAVASISDAVAMPCPSVVAQIVPTQSGSGTPSPSNIRSLSGSTSATITRCGKNQFTSANEETGKFISNEGNVLSSSGWKCSDFIPVKGGVNYNFQPNTLSGNSAKHAYYTDTKAFISYIDSGAQSFTTPTNCRYMRFSYRETSTNIQLEFGSVPTTYTPYTEIDSHTASFGTTVLRGSHNFTTGALESTDGIATLNDLEFYYTSAYSIPIFFASISDKKRAAMTLVSEAFEFIGSFANAEDFIAAATSDNVIGCNSSNRNILIRADSYLSTTALYQAVGTTKVTYEKATADTYTLTPQTITTAQGVNNFYADTGDTSVTYYREKPPLDVILEDGVVSDTSNYRTATFSDISGYSKIIITFKWETGEQINGVVYDVSAIGNGLNFGVSLQPINVYVYFYLTTTSIASTQYGGNFHNIYATIQGIA